VASLPESQRKLESNKNNSFHVTLDVYSGPFDVLLDLIASKKLELTQVSLAAVTDEFIDFLSHLSSDNPAVKADKSSSFLRVASILVEAKSVRLLPSGVDPEDEESIQALEESDLLFAHLLQYKAFKEASEQLASHMKQQGGLHAHHPLLPSRVVSQLSDIRVGLSTTDLKDLAGRVIANAPARSVGLRQLHVPLADVKKETAWVADRLQSLHGRATTFDALVADATSRAVICARFWALLLLFRAQHISFRQTDPFAPLELKWVENNG
jgi:segregation and condensation protein A